MRRLAVLLALASALTYPAAQAQTDKYQITAAERVACQPDVQRRCAAAYANEDKMIACMKANQRSLSANCATTFAAGLKRRGMR